MKRKASQFNPETPLQGWKEISSYLERDERTARRWELQERLPIRRHREGQRGSVYAYPSEIEAWRASRSPKADFRAGDSPATKSVWPARLVPVLAGAAVLALAGLAIRVSPVMNPPFPVAQAADGTGGLVTEQLWAGGGVNVQGSVSQDGRLLSFTDWRNGGHLAVRDLEKGLSRRLASTGADTFSTSSRISPDGKLVAYGWYDFARNSADLRVLPVDGSEQEPRIVWAPEDGDVSPMAWFPDGERIAAVVARPDGSSQIVTVAIASGAVSQIRSTGWNSTSAISMSPDGRYLAYERTPSRENPKQDIFLVSVDGRSEMAIVEHPAHDSLVGWSPEGEHILFTSDRSGQSALWALRIHEGAAADDPFLVKSNLEFEAPLGITPDGSVYYGVRSPRRNVEIAEVDLQTGKLSGEPSRPISRFVGANSGAAFSRDGAKLAYVSTRHGPRSKVIVIRSLATGAEKDLPSRTGFIGSLNWSSDSKHLATVSYDDRGGAGLYRIDAANGETELLVRGDREDLMMNYPAWAPDGKRIYYRTYGDENRKLYSYSLADGSVDAVAGDFGGDRFSLSPDGRWIASVNSGEDGVTGDIRLLPVEGGPARVIWSTEPPDALGRFVAWTPDGEALIVWKRVIPDTKNRMATLWIVPLDGSDPIESELRTDYPYFFPLSIHPDGRRVAYSTGKTIREIWVLRNLSFERRETSE